MKHDHFVVQSPDTPAKQLLLLFHGVGDNAVNMGQIGSWFAPVFPHALIVSIGGVEPCGPDGRQWFSVEGVTEENRQARIDAVMPAFIDTVRYWQQQSGVGANATALIGFSQGYHVAGKRKSAARTGVPRDCLQWAFCDVTAKRDHADYDPSHSWG